MSRQGLYFPLSLEFFKKFFVEGQENPDQNVKSRCQALQQISYKDAGKKILSSI